MKRTIPISLLILTSLIFTLFHLIASPLYFPITKTAQVAVNVPRIRHDVATLANTPQPRNSYHMESLNMAASYIKEEFSKVSERVTEQTYQVGANTFKNIICSFGPLNGERIVIGAHYDVCDDQQGADDNASGVAGLLELARLFDSLQTPLQYRVDLVAYSLEEPPYFRSESMGSHIHAKSLKDSNVVVKAMLCLEMIGYFSDKKGSQDYPVGLLHLFYPNKGNFIAVVGKLGKGQLSRTVKKGIKASSGIEAVSINAPSSLPGIDFSDHLNYWNFNYPAVMITNTAFYRNKNYHQVTDTPNTLDYQKMAEVIKGVYGAVISITP